jgi:hypothetical protein
MLSIPCFLVMLLPVSVSCTCSQAATSKCTSWIDLASVLQAYLPQDARVAESPAVHQSTCDSRSTASSRRQYVPLCHGLCCCSSAGHSNRPPDQTQQEQLQHGSNEIYDLEMS